MGYTTYNCDELLGGTDRCLDNLSVAVLNDKDRAICAVSGDFLYFVYDAEGTAAEQTTNHPYIVRPDDYSTGGNWVEFVIPGALSGVAAITSTPYGVAADEMNTVFVISRSDPTVVNLPDGAAGLVGATLEFHKRGTGSVTINAYSANTIGGGTSIANATTEVEANLTLRLVATATWAVTGGNGSWPVA